MNEITPMAESISSLFRDPNKIEKLILTVDGVDTEWEYVALSWKEKSDCLSRALKITPSENGKGATLGLDLTVYFSQALIKMIKRGPVPITPQTLEALRADVGEKLQSIVPTPFDSAVEEEALKKE